MNDPWDVKSVRQAGQYVSCMKLNGVPLLPPILSKECRKEMQYYKLLAKEVEKRINLLQPYILDSDTDTDNMTDAPELPECEQNFTQALEDTQDDFELDIDKITAKNKEKYLVDSQRTSPIKDLCNNLVLESLDIEPPASPKFTIDLRLRINETTKNDSTQKSQYSTPQMDLPERDYNCTRKVTQRVITEKEVITEVETQRYTKKKETEAVAKFSCNIINKPTDPLPDIPVLPEGPSSLSSKSFTGSLNDLHSESTKDLLSQPLTRQRSYTILNPSPQLLAHLEVQALNTGIEMTAISMSESLSNLSMPNKEKKRRSWDLESAKMKWSTMAMELNQTKVNNKNSKNPVPKKASPPAQTKSSPPAQTKVSPPVQAKAKSVTPPERVRRSITTPKSTVRSEPLPRTNATPKPEALLRHRKSSSPTRNGRSPTKDIMSAPMSRADNKPEAKQAISLVSEPADPATRVRELYEKIQNQQLIQMASLVEKQKKEQMLLQQVFEEQNNLLFNQLKTICPKSPIEMKEAWGEKHSDGDRGPVSLSQLINLNSDPSPYESPLSATLTDTTTYISHCDNVLKKSRDITGSIKKQPIKAITQSSHKTMTPKQAELCRGKRSPTKSTPTSRRLNYETSASSDRDYDQMLTDRTNDTMADLNVTFPSDNSDDGSLYNDRSKSFVRSKELTTIHAESYKGSPVQPRQMDNAIKSLERSIQNSINSTSTRVSKCSIGKTQQPPTPAERAAASKIVAYAKGYLVRRLMRTERVQTTVQTIKDALLCALQLHQDREGIRGADVDLHRRLIQQITAACYTLHDTFVASSPAERCAMIAADRGRRLSLAARQANNSLKQTDSQMSQSHCGSFPTRPALRPAAPASNMTQSNYETSSMDDKSDDGQGSKRSSVSVSRYTSPHRRPWR